LKAEVVQLLIQIWDKEPALTRQNAFPNKRGFNGLGFAGAACNYDDWRSICGERDSLSDGQTHGIFLSSDNFFGIITRASLRDLVAGLVWELVSGDKERQTLFPL
jgi:hypothetical protein